MLPASRPFTFDRVVRLILTVALLYGLIRLLGFLSDVLIPFAIAFLLAYMVNPLVSWIERRIPNRLVAVLGSLVLVLAAAGLILWAIVPQIVNEIGRMGRIVSELANNAGLAQRATAILPEDLWSKIKELLLQPEVRDLFNPQTLWKVTETTVRRVLPGLWGVITGTASVLMGVFGLFVIGLYLVFLLLDYPQVSHDWKELLPEAYREPVAMFLMDFEGGMNRYFRGQALVASIGAVLYVIGFSLIGLPLAIVLGLVVGAMGMVPYLTLVGVVPAALLALFHALETSGNIWLVLGLTLSVFVVVQSVQDWVLTPRIMGKVTGLNPAMIMLSLSIWGKLLGMLGLIIALPMTCLLLAYYRRIIKAGAPVSDEAP